jgi:hypothetical protein
MCQRKDHCDIPSIGETEDMGFLNGVLIHKIQKVFSKLPDGERSITTWRLPVSPCVYRHDSEMLSKELHLVQEVTAVLTIPVKQNQGESLSLFDIMWIFHPDSENLVQIYEKTGNYEYLCADIFVKLKTNKKTIDE